MSKKTFSYFIWLVGVIAVAVFLFWLFDSHSVTRESQEVQRTQGDAAVSFSSDIPASDTVVGGSVASGMATSSGGRVLVNTVAHYRVSVPMTWYVENRSVMNLALYPDYDPKSGVQPSCKIEISVLSNVNRLALDDWLTGYLLQDPTVDITESSRTASQVSGRSAIIWSGNLNGVSTTLAYLLGDGMVYEFAPSGDCQSSFRVILKNFTITSS